MDQLALNKYLQSMETGEWGDGIMLSAAVRLYGRPIVINTSDGAEQMVDAAWESSAERVRLGLINTNHYVSINEINVDENSDSFVAEPEHTVNECGSDTSLIPPAGQAVDTECQADSADTSTTGTTPPCDNKIDDSKLKVIGFSPKHFVCLSL